MGACLTVPQFISNSSMKAWLGRTFEVRLIDMESYWVNEAARGAGVPQLSVKVMLDPVERNGAGIRGRHPVQKPRLQGVQGRRVYGCESAGNAGDFPSRQAGQEV